MRVAVGLRQAAALRKQIAERRGQARTAVIAALDAFAAAIDRAAGAPILVPGEEWFDTELSSTLARLASWRSFRVRTTPAPVSR